MLRTPEPNCSADLQSRIQAPLPSPEAQPDAGTLILLDGNSYLHRSFFSLPPLNSTKGEPVGAVYGVTNMLLKLIQQQAPRWLAVVFDGPGPALRDKIRAQFKYTRRERPPELTAQTEPLTQIVRAMGLPVLKVNGHEADDVIATLARQAVAQGVTTLISTCDKDMAQLVDEQLVLINSMTGERMDREAVKAKYNVYPERIVDYLALIGDSPDDIPGVQKVGARTATKWLEDFGSLQGVLDNANSIQGKGKGPDNLRAGFREIELSRQLATIHCDLPVKLDLRSLEPRAPDKQLLRRLYERMDFKTLLKDLSAEAESAAAGNELLAMHRPLPTLAVKPKSLPKKPEDATPAPVERRYETIYTSEDFERWLDILRAAPLFSFDTETTSLEYMKAELVGLSFCAEPGHAAYVPVAHRYPGAPEQLSRTEVLAKLRPLLEDPLRSKVGHHLKYDAHILSNYGIELNGMHYDSMIESYVVNSTATRHDMDSVAERYLGVKSFSFEELCGKGRQQITIDLAPIERAAAYAAEDADIALRLHLCLWGKITRTPGLKDLYEKIEQPLAPVLKRMEENGVLVDCEALKVQSGQIAERMREVAQKACREAGQAFNPESPKQLREILFDKMKLPVLYKTPKGVPSTAEDVLEELAMTYELPRLVSEYRQLSKLKSTYLDKLPELLNSKTGRLHTSYHHAVAATGRLTTTKPNFQGVPVRTVDGRRVRQAIIAAPNCLLITADYSQIELRILAHLSRDERLIDAFKRDLDIHCATAAEVFGVPLEEVTEVQRQSAKSVNFGLIYGMTAFGLGRQLGIDKEAAQEYIDLYFEHYPQIRACLDGIRGRAREKGYVETLYGRRLYLPTIRSRVKSLRAYAERRAINAPMQGTAADIIKRAMIAIDRWIKVEKVPAKIILQVHDELVLEAERSEAQRVREGIEKHMLAAAELSVPMRVNIGVGFNWDETR